MSLRPRKVEFEKLWSTIHVTINNVITCSSTVQRTTWNNCFTDIYALCVASPISYGDKLYQQTQKFLNDYVIEKRKEILSGADNELLMNYSIQWMEFWRGTGYLNQLFGYLNNQIKRNNYSEAELIYGGFSREKVFEIGVLAFMAWRDEMIIQIKPTLSRLLVDSISFDDSKLIDYNVLKCVLSSLVEVDSVKDNVQTTSSLKLYHEIFEEVYLQNLYDYYVQDSQLLLDSNTCSDYMIKVIKKLEHEDMRCRKFMNHSSHIKVKSQCEKAMVLLHSDTLHTSCITMVKEENRQDLLNMYHLMVNLSLSILVSEVENHIKNVGLEKIKNLENNAQISIAYVDTIYELHLKYSELISECFSNNPKFVGAMDKAFNQVINNKSSSKQVIRSPELVARYCDLLLRKGMKGMSESELDDRMQNVITVFKYLDDKDLFQKHYSKMLARRLIQSLSTSMDNEEAMINRLKQTCGYEYTQKMHRMFTDVSISSDLSCKYEEYADKASLSNMVLVLQAGAWPISQNNTIDFLPPKEFVPTIDAYTNFYKKNFNGRKLTWMYHLGTVDLKLNYLNKVYSVTMNCHQAAVMLKFNGDLQEDVNCGVRFTRTQIQESTQLPFEDLDRVLGSLYDAKLLLACDEHVKLNTDFTSKRIKFKIISNQQKILEYNQDVEKTNTTVDEDRKMYLQAAIVRIMKTRKMIKHSLLIPEVIKQCSNRFIPNVGIIKKTVESLIEKSYIERTEQSQDTYCYVA